MKLLAKIIFWSFLILMFNLAVQAQSSWIGSYEFNEDGGKNAGGTAIFIEYQLGIKQTENGLMAMLQSNGYQTSKDLICTAKADGDKLSVYFESYGENNIFESYEPGDLLFTLERKTVKNKTEILTFWNKFLPVVPKNGKSGKLYFVKTN